MSLGRTYPLSKIYRIYSSNVCLQVHILSELLLRHILAIGKWLVLIFNLIMLFIGPDNLTAILAKHH